MCANVPPPDCSCSCSPWPGFCSLRHAQGALLLKYSGTLAVFWWENTPFRQLSCPNESPDAGLPVPRRVFASCPVAVTATGHTLGGDTRNGKFLRHSSIATEPSATRAMRRGSRCVGTVGGMVDNWGKVGASRRGVARRAIFNQAYRGTTSSGTFGTLVIPSTDGVCFSCGRMSVVARVSRGS